MRAMVMAAGKGTRLAPLTDILPKPTLPVANEPAMGHMLRLLARHGFSEVIVNISYMADEMRAVFGDGTPWGVRIEWSQETELLGTSGGVKNCEWFLRQGDEPVLVLSGDGLHDADLSGIVRAHREAGAIATIGLTRVADTSEYGVAILDDDGLITQFQEKPPLGEELSDLASTGIYVIDPALFDRIEAGSFHDFGDDMWPDILKRGERLLGVHLPGYWNDIGGLEAYREGNLDAVSGALDSYDAVHDDRYGEGVLVHPSARIAPDATIIGPCVIGADVEVGAGARIARSVLLPGAKVGEGVILTAATYGDVTGLSTWADSLGSVASAAR